MVRSEKGIPEVEAAWLREHRSDLRILDVREPDELSGALGSLPDVENIPLGELEATIASWGDADPEEPLVVVCRSGGRSGRAALLLERAGFARVASLKGGMLAVRALDADGGDACGT